jgi:predicted NAD/FAD-dependent oxidoreductase
MVYSGAELAHKLDGLDDEAVVRLYTADIVDMIPELRGKVADVRIQRWLRGLPHPRPGRAAVQADLERPLGNLYLAGDYLGTRYVETAISTGVAAAHTIRARLRTAGKDRVFAESFE